MMSAHFLVANFTNVVVYEQFKQFFTGNWGNDMSAGCTTGPPV